MHLYSIVLLLPYIGIYEVFLETPYVVKSHENAEDCKCFIIIYEYVAYANRSIMIIAVGDA